MLNNIALDHKSLDELRPLFRDFVAKAETAVLNLDDDETRLLAAALPRRRLRTYSLQRERRSVRLRHRRGAVRDLVHGRRDVTCACRCRAGTMSGTPWPRSPRPRPPACRWPRPPQALAGFAGLQAALRAGRRGGRRHRDRRFRAQPRQDRRDAAHAPRLPRPAAGVLSAARLRPAQDDGERIRRLLRREMAAEDVLIMPDPVYYGGTAGARSAAPTSSPASPARAHAEHVAERAGCADRLLALARPGDRIVVMGARDDTLTLFAEDLVARLSRDRKEKGGPEGPPQFRDKGARISRRRRRPSRPIRGRRPARGSTSRARSPRPR